ncbi:MAG: (Fe-S)-binding protein [Clostridia bacterium]|nr:(Fe-S)-binding protein [Clostridia bacterium]
MNKEEVLKKILNCNKCGLCQEVCPTYKISGHEFAVARGRLRLIRMALEGELDLNGEPELEEFVNECLLCKACEVNCPSFVPVSQIISEIRENYTQVKGLPLTKRLMYWGVFSKNKNLNLIRKMALIYQGTGANRIVKGVKFLKKSPLNLLPKLTKKSVREQLPEILKEIANPKHRVAYFLGCSVNNFFSEIGVASIKVLQENNCQVVIPEVSCCGAPHKSAGDREETIRLAKINLRAFKDLDVEAIVVDCSTCGSVLMEYAEILKDDQEYGELAQNIANLITDISAYLVKIDFRKPEGQLPLVRVTYHDPCHGIRSLKVQKEPRKILEAIPGVKLVEMRDAASCCGGAGSYSIFQAKTSKKVLKEKMANYQETEADILATSCPACTMQLGYGIELANLSGVVKHPVELLAQAYEKEK